MPRPSGICTPTELISLFCALALAPLSWAAQPSISPNCPEQYARAIESRTLRSLDPKYAGEDQGKMIDGAFYETRYLRDPKERARYRIRIQNGRFVDPSGKPLDSGKKPHIYVMDPQGNLYVSNEAVPLEFHHSSFLAGEPVAAAGTAWFENGKLIQVDNRSGHYKPPSETLKTLLKAIQAQGYDTREVYAIPVQR